MNINVFLVCYNESALLPHTIKHYRKYLPSCVITVIDNHSTDNSVELAKSLGCNHVAWDTGNSTDEFKLRDLKNNCWKHISDGWIIMADMDEYLCVTEDVLMEEKVRGTSILQVCGLDMLGESQTLDLSDIDLQDIKKYVHNHYENKKLCFLREKITDMNYECGAHSCNPTGVVSCSSNIYINKHMNFLGLSFTIDKMLQRYARSEDMRKLGMDVHYTNSKEEATSRYLSLLNSCSILE